MSIVKRNSEVSPFSSNFLEDFLNSGILASNDKRGLPALNIKEDDKELTLELRIPGLKKEDIQLDYNNGILTLSGERNVVNWEEYPYKPIVAFDIARSKVNLYIRYFVKGTNRADSGVQSSYC